MTRDDLLTYDGITQPITEWALDYGITPEIIIRRLKGGMPVARAIEKPMLAKPGDLLPEPAREPSNYGRRYSFNGQTLTVPEWAKRTGLTTSAIRYRLRSGWPIERVFSEGAGVVSNLCPSIGTGAGSTAQEIPEIKNPEKANSA